MRRSPVQFLTTSRQPASSVTLMIAASTASTLGEAKISPQTAAVSMPSPTNPGVRRFVSCPATRDHCYSAGAVSARTTTLMSG